MKVNAINIYALSTLTAPLVICCGPSLQELQRAEYGYQWWAATAGAHHFDVAIGHGGQYIALVRDRNMVIAVLSDPFHGQHDSESWEHELGNLNMISDFIESLPKEDK